MLVCAEVLRVDLTQVASVNLRVKRNDNKQTKCQQSGLYSESPSLSPLVSTLLVVVVVVVVVVDCLQTDSHVGI